MKVTVVMGSKSDLPKVTNMITRLQEYQVEVQVRVLSAHRAPALLRQCIEETNTDNTEVIIAVAGKAAHLPGVIASMTILPVIGVPIKGSALDGMDALLSIVQMPTGVPVASVAIDGGDNAALLALEMLALKYNPVREQLLAFRKKMEADVLTIDQEIQKSYQ